MPVFHPGVNHAHSPSGKWSVVQAHPNSSFELNMLCPRLTPRELVGAAMLVKFRDKPIALDHLMWYSITGLGRDYDENANLSAMLTTDTGVQAAIRAILPSGRTSGTVTTYLKIEQSDYDSQDLRFAFGAIDRLDLEANFTAGTLHAWFKDRYEWHPYYAGLYTAFPDDGARDTNCVHAALVELKSSGAADFWMVGEATAPLSAVMRPAGAAAAGGSDY
jgi:hypothetical protein